MEKGRLEILCCLQITDLNNMNSTFRQFVVFGTIAICLLSIAIITIGFSPLIRPSDSQAELSLLNLTAPPTFSFWIWGVIYLGFLAYGVYEALPITNKNSRFKKSFPWIMISIAMNVLWIILVGFDLVLMAYLLQWLMLYASFMILIQAKPIDKTTPLFEKIVSVPFNFYAGWLTVAMVPFTSDLLLSYGWSGQPLSPIFWAIALYLIAAAIVYFSYRHLNDIWYVLPIVWAFFGLAVKFEGFVSYVSGGLAAVGFIFVIIQLSKKWRFVRQ